MSKLSNFIVSIKRNGRVNLRQVFFNYGYFSALLLLGASLTHCSTYQGLSKKENKRLSQTFEASPVFSKIFTGFALFDPKLDTFLFEVEADKYYTPASNTKLYTLYSSTMILGDSLPVLSYIQSGDSLIFWGTGNPLFLHPDFDLPNIAFDFLKNTPQQLFFTNEYYEDERFGPGWSWADYAYAYQVEKSSFPIHANFIRFHKKADGPLQVSPSTAKEWVVEQDTGPILFRPEHQNVFFLNKAAIEGKAIDRYVPYKTDDTTIVKILSDTLNRPVYLYPSAIDTNKVVKTIRMPVPDTMLRQFMRQSDNFLAEQLMLMSSYELSGKGNTRSAINFSIDSLLTFLPDRPIWRDGSGLSRYNLFTPRTTIKLLQAIQQTIPEDTLFDILPTGGVSGTIKSWYGADQPYVFAKTGTLSNKHCLSGFIRTRSGRLLLFSFMNNNYVNGSSEVKEAMQHTLEWIRDNL